MRGPRARPGFTLIEVMVVLIILAIMAATAVPALRSEMAPDDDLTVAARTLESVFRMARDSAARGGAPVTVVVDSATGLVWFVVPPTPGSVGEVVIPDGTAGPPRTGLNGATGATGTPAFEPGAELGLPRSVRLEMSSARARFTITPHGLALGDSLTLRRGGAVLTLTLDPWTADVIAF